MREQEVRCFARSLQLTPDQIAVHSLLESTPDQATIKNTDLFLLGGSGRYSATGNDTWLHQSLDLLRELHDRARPVFASCWGFQAMARALGGRVVHDPEHAELGTQSLTLTEAGRGDSVFSPVGSPFLAQMGHEDCVVELPAGAVHLAQSSTVAHQAYRFEGRPIYCTQFHPELQRDDLLGRVKAYPEYVERIAGVSIESFYESVQDTPASESILIQFLKEIVEPLLH